MNKLFSTREFYLSCFLHCKGMKLIEVKKLNGGNRSEFVFEDSPARQKLVSAYWEDTGHVSAKSFAASVKELKNRLYTDSF